MALKEHARKDIELNLGMFIIMWNKNTFFHKNNTLTTEIQQLALSNWLSYWPIIFNQDMNIPKFNSMSFLACSLRAMTVL
jgi:hypothetical protein